MVLYEIVELIKMFSLYDKTRRVAYVLYLISFIMCIKRVYAGEKLENLFAYIRQPQHSYNEPLYMQCYINNLRYIPICERIMVLGWKFLKVASGMNTFLVCPSSAATEHCLCLYSRRGLNEKHEI